MLNPQCQTLPNHPNTSARQRQQRPIHFTNSEPRLPTDSHCHLFRNAEQDPTTQIPATRRNTKRPLPKTKQRPTAPSSPFIPKTNSTNHSSFPHSANAKKSLLATQPTLATPPPTNSSLPGQQAHRSPYPTYLATLGLPLPNPPSPKPYPTLPNGRSTQPYPTPPQPTHLASISLQVIVSP